MSRFIKRRKKKIGSLPGTLIYTGKKVTEPIKIHLINYNEQLFHEKEFDKIEDYKKAINEKIINWINVDGIHELNIIEKIGQIFKIHPLILEDILNIEQRPKIEILDDYISIIFKFLNLNHKENELIIDQIGIIFGSNFVISINERKIDIFDSIIERMKTEKGRIRKSGPDYLAYSLIDVVVDNYFVILDKIGEKMEDLEEELIDRPTVKTLHEIYRLKNDLIVLRKSIWPLREVINRILRRESPLIHESSYIYFRDIYDHIIQVIDTVENYRDMLSGMLDIYLSSVSNKMNEIMKILTIIATIFIPLTFITSLYGMNFVNMPELYWDLGYPIILIIILIIAISMIIYFKKKTWL